MILSEYRFGIELVEQLVDFRLSRTHQTGGYDKNVKLVLLSQRFVSFCKGRFHA